jgi:ferric-dicitrate binding protein FerR (iron transport regulator)
MKQHIAKHLIDKYHQGQCTPEEKALIEAGFNEILKHNSEIYPIGEIEDADRRMRANITAHVNAGSDQSKPIRLWVKFTAAASVVLMLSAGLIFYLGRENRPAQQTVSIRQSEDIAPGKNTATLTLSDGRKVILSEAGNGQLAEQAGVTISKTSDGQIRYDIDSGDGNTSKQLAINTLSTANGETYRVVLPDGTKVWLNAASSLKYPASFASLKERKVELNGEAYFEVQRDKSRPFIVNSSDQQVKVLGTHFNINSYADEPYTKTTLLEGEVKVSASNAQATLQPGQQASLNKKQLALSVAQADIEEAMAWKNGYFMFTNENIGSVMKKIARWYDVEIIYEQEVSTKAVWGTISRFRNVSQVLNMLEMTGVVKFKMEGRRIIVKP